MRFPDDGIDDEDAGEFGDPLDEGQDLVPPGYWEALGAILATLPRLPEEPEGAYVEPLV